jgi:Ca2+-binding EF-hand superfamily protein
LEEKMGNDVSSNHRMGITAMALTTLNIHTKTVTDMARRMKELSNASGNKEIITKIELEDALKYVQGLDDSDYEIFRSVFIMFDDAGESQINYREFIAGIAACLVVGSVHEKLQLALTLYDVEKSGVVTRGDLKKLLHAINNTASYFGDVVVTADLVESAVNDTFFAISDATNSSAPVLSVSIKDCVEHLSKYKAVELFSSGKGTVRFGR